MTIDLSLILLAVSAVAAVLLVILGLPSFLRWLADRKRGSSTSLNGVPPTAPALQLHFWSQSVKVDSEPPVKPPAPTPANVATARKRSSRTPRETILFNDTLEVEATGHAEVHASLPKGARVAGFAQETSGQPFDFYIMDRRNYVGFCEDREGTEIYHETDRVALDFQKTIPRDGVWYFVLDTYGKQSDRDVRLELRVTEPS